MGASSECSPPPPRPINVTGTGTYKGSYMGQSLYLNKDAKPIQGKLFLLLPGIGNSGGAGGFESFVQVYGFHVFSPHTNTNLTGGMVPQMYKDTIKTDPMNKEANRQVGDARMEEWDGKDRVSWFTAPTPILDETIGAIKYAMRRIRAATGASSSTPTARCARRTSTSSATRGARRRGR
jgi:hypothetical protein